MALQNSSRLGRHLQLCTKTRKALPGLELLFFTRGVCCSTERIIGYNLRSNALWELGKDLGISLRWKKELSAEGIQRWSAFTTGWNICCELARSVWKGSPRILRAVYLVWGLMLLRWNIGWIKSLELKSFQAAKRWAFQRSLDRFQFCHLDSNPPEFIRGKASASHYRNSFSAKNIFVICSDTQDGALIECIALPMAQMFW